MTITHNLGLPRIGPNRELKKAVEAYWKGQSSPTQLKAVGQQLRQQNWQWQADADQTFVSVGDFAWYDPILEWSYTIGVIPQRFQALHAQRTDDEGLDVLFAMGRGVQTETQSIDACEMTKWYDTNYHYIVPELAVDQSFVLTRHTLFDQIKEAQALGQRVKPIIPGPVTYLALSKGQGFEVGTQTSSKLKLLPALLNVYKAVFNEFKALGIEWVQLDESYALLDLDTAWQEALVQTYTTLSQEGLKLLVATYFESPEPNQALLKRLPVQGVHIDITRVPVDLARFASDWPANKVLSLGVLSGREIWRTDLENVIAQIQPVLAQKTVWLAPASSLLHVPYDVEPETQLSAELKQSLAFARQKLHELKLLAHHIDGTLTDQESKEWEAQKQALVQRRASSKVHNPAVQARLKEVDQIALHRTPFAQRNPVQHASLNLPLYPTTTIGSFPQTPDIRRLRQAWRKHEVSDKAYEDGMKAQIAEVIRVQEDLDIDVLVHGEAERNDMVEYFGELLAGFAFTQNGWVQSYGSRCVKPPIIYGDIQRLIPMTVSWISYAQSLTQRPVKGMLTGPVTMLQWSFVRDDQPRSETCKQLALVLRDEIRDLEKAGIQVIQLDEPAIREGLPLRQEKWDDYLQWAVDCFLLATSVVQDSTQIHTHMCYSEFNDIIQAIARMDADVITIETSRSDMALLKAFEDFDYPNEIGPGVYDIHSPNVPTHESIVHLMQKAAQKIPAKRLWVNPDCGLKTRQWKETKVALNVMVQAAKTLRSLSV